MKYLTALIVIVGLIYGVMQIRPPTATVNTNPSAQVSRDTSEPFIRNDSGPKLKVRIANDQITNIRNFYIQSRDERPMVITDVVINGNPVCTDFAPSVPTKRVAVTLRLGEETSVFLSCKPVKVVISTSLGSATFTD